MFNLPLFKALGIKNNADLKTFARKVKVSTKELKYYNEKNVLPSVSDRKAILKESGMTELELKLKLGILDGDIVKAIQEKSDQISRLIQSEYNSDKEIKRNHTLSFSTDLGKLYQGDCLSLMKEMEDESIDFIFADPPFNLDKKYESGMNDNVEDQTYLQWTELWLLECIRILKKGGSIFIWNLPKWNTYIASILNKYLEFKHWIAVGIKYRLPIRNRLYPAHYGLLYYTKGEKPNAFNEQRLPLEICRHCAGDIHDYGGYKDKLNPKGINLTDVWEDIPPVRHSKFKTRGSNELSLKLLERVISLASNENDLVFDPFGGSGTTYIAAQILKRRWIGIELGSTDMIIKRFSEIDWQRKYVDKIQENNNVLFTKEMKEKRLKNGHWLPETLNKDNEIKSTKKSKENNSQISLNL